MSALSNYLLGTPPYAVQLQLLEFGHPNFSITYRVVRNAVGGVSVHHEDGSGPFIYTYFPLSIKANGSADDLDQSVDITFGDLGQFLPDELDRISDANNFGRKPQVNYRLYNSLDLTTPIYGPLILQVDSIAFNKQGATIKAVPQSFTKGRIGEYYVISRFPTLQHA